MDNNDGKPTTSAKVVKVLQIMKQSKPYRDENNDSNACGNAATETAGDNANYYEQSSTNTAWNEMNQQHSSDLHQRFHGTKQFDGKNGLYPLTATYLSSGDAADSSPPPPPPRPEPPVTGFSMREQDAEILEAMHDDGTTGHTPLFTSIKRAPPPVEELLLPSTLDESPHAPDSSTKTTTHDYYSTDNGASIQQELSPMSTFTSSLRVHPLPSSESFARRSLSGEVTLRGSEKAAVPSTTRTSSLKEIRIQEVAAFAEAVGDTSVLMCDIAINEDYSDDDESDNETGSVIHQRLLDPLLPAATSETDTMVGISTPDIVQRGVMRGNYATLHRKALLEVSDKYHRYGKHLRMYYKHWESLGCPTNQFFDWLDSKGGAAGLPLPEVNSCPRKILDSDTVLYITNTAVTEKYRLVVTTDRRKRARLLDRKGNPVETGPDGWIFVLRDHVLYAAPKITSVVDHSTQRFHHSSFFGGKAVAAAGILITEDKTGTLLHLYPHSGHYRPTAAHLQRVLFFLYDTGGVDLSSVMVDAQQIWHVARDPDAPKRAQLHLVSAMDVALFLAHKARSIPSFGRLHGIGRAPTITTVREALAVIDPGGCWERKVIGKTRTVTER